MTTRRSFITGLISFVAAPAIVRAGSLMPVRVMEHPPIVYRDPYRLAEWIAEDAPYMLSQDFVTEIVNTYMPRAMLSRARQLGAFD